MNFGRAKLILSFALLGFIVGTLTYLAFDCFVLNKSTTITMLEIVRSSWFISGIAGAVMSVTIALTYAHFSKN